MKTIFSRKFHQDVSSIENDGGRGASLEPTNKQGLLSHLKEKQEARKEKKAASLMDNQENGAMNDKGVSNKGVFFNRTLKNQETKSSNENPMSNSGIFKKKDKDSAQDKIGPEVSENGAKTENERSARSLKELLSGLFHTTNSNRVYSENYVAQDKSWNCGPTACAIAADVVGAGQANKLAPIFTSAQGGGAMSWGDPQRFLEGIGCNVDQRSNTTPHEMAAHIRSGGAVLVSVGSNSPLTTSGHIICLGGVSNKGGKQVFENLDPNYRNMQRGYDVLNGENVVAWGKQFWFVSREQGGEYHLASNGQDVRSKKARV